MSGAALTFRVFGRPCVVDLPPTLDGVAPANDAHEPTQDAPTFAQSEAASGETIAQGGDVNERCASLTERSAAPHCLPPEATGWQRPGRSDIQRR